MLMEKKAGPAEGGTKFAGPGHRQLLTGIPWPDEISGVRTSANAPKMVTPFDGVLSHLVSLSANFPEAWSGHPW